MPELTNASIIQRLILHLKEGAFLLICDQSESQKKTHKFAFSASLQIFQTNDWSDRVSRLPTTISTLAEPKCHTRADRRKRYYPETVLLPSHSSSKVPKAA
jgi:hypothetical protein